MATATYDSIVNYDVGDVGDDATQWSAWDAETGGVRIRRNDFSNNPVALIANQFYRVEAGEIVFTVPQSTDGGTAEEARRAARGIVAGGVWVQLEASTNVAVTERRQLPESGFTIA